MNVPARAALALLSGALLLTAGCRNQPPEYTEQDDAVPEGVSVEPPAQAPATGGVTLPGEVDADTPQLAPSPGTDTMRVGPDTAPRPR